jgi:hypothetical protein
VDQHELTTEMEDEGVKGKILKRILKKQGASLHSGFFALRRVQWRKYLSTMMNSISKSFSNNTQYKIIFKISY